MSVHILIDGTYDQYWFKHDSISMHFIDQRTFPKSSINIESILIDVLIINIAQYRSMVPKIFGFLLFDQRWSMVSTMFSKLCTCASINIDCFYQYWLFLSILINIDHRWFMNCGFYFYPSFYVSTLINIDQCWSILIFSYRFFFQICSTTSRSTWFLRHTVILLVPYATVYIGSWEQRFSSPDLGHTDRILGNAHSLTITLCVQVLSGRAQWVANEDIFLNASI